MRMRMEKFTQIAYAFAMKATAMQQRTTEIYRNKTQVTLIVNQSCARQMGARILARMGSAKDFIVTQV